MDKQTTTSVSHVDCSVSPHANEESLKRFRTAYPIQITHDETGTILALSSGFTESSAPALFIEDEDELVLVDELRENRDLSETLDAEIVCRRSEKFDDWCDTHNCVWGWSDGNKFTSTCDAV